MIDWFNIEFCINCEQFTQEKIIIYAEGLSMFSDVCDK